MRKYDEGYALPFAVVVMLVLCLVAVSILTVSLHNLQNQQASIERMQDKYEAQGKVEALIAQYETVIVQIANPYNGSLDDAKKKVVEELGINVVKWTENGGKYSCETQLTVRGGPNNTVEIVCMIVLNDVIVSQDSALKIQKPTITYESYTITYLDTPASAETTEVTP